MDLWKARNDAITYLNANRTAQVCVLLDIFGTIDSCIDSYEDKSDKDEYSLVCGLTLLKAKNLAIGSYSLILDGLAQEAGSLMRPFIEYMELLTYFGKFPEKVSRAISNNLPNAGERAKAIMGNYKEFRDHLNKHASHSSYSDYSFAHLREPGSLKFKKLQRAFPQVIDINLQNLTIHTYCLLKEAVISLERVNSLTFYELAERVDALRLRLIDEFALTSS